jgi:hypothetical protein
MTTKQLENLVNGIKKPNLKSSEIDKLFQDDRFQRVAQPKTHQVAQDKPQQVAQAVAQGSWVAQTVPERVAQNKPLTVVQKIPQQVVQSLVDIDVEKFKEQIYQIQGIEERKKFVLSIGFAIASEKRGGNKSYLYGIKKIDGKKYRLYIGNSTKL